jgi:ankyrin repeat protein
MEMGENDEHRALHYAVFARSPEIVRVLLEHGADAYRGIYPHRDATSAITIARERGYGEIVAVIESHNLESHNPATVPEELEELDQSTLERRPELVNACDRRGWSPLHTASATFDERFAAWLIEHGADVNRRGPGGRTPLDVAAGAAGRRAGAPDRFAAFAALLLRHGAELTPRAAVALGEAAWLRARHTEAPVSNPADGGAGLLSVAVRRDRPEMLALLLDFGFDPDERTRLEDLEDVVYSWGMPLHHCARSGKLKMAEMLLDRGADPNGQVYASGSVMYAALAAHDAAMVELLARRGGFADAATVGHLRLVDQARRMFEEQDAGTLRQGSYMNVNGSLAQELLWAALRGGSPEIVRMALPRIGWPRESPDWFGMLWSPLPGHMPRSTEDQALFLECFRLVLERCDPNVRHPRVGRSVLHDVAASDDAVSAEEAIAFATPLLDAGARLDARDDLLRSTPLGWACRWGRAELVKLLLERGADPVEADAEPWASPRAWARKMDRDDLLALLE